MSNEYVKVSKSSIEGIVKLAHSIAANAFSQGQLEDVNPEVSEKCKQVKEKGLEKLDNFLLVVHTTRK